ncbi:DUF4209 domain-containing protein [Flavobacterium chilense]|uniref:DUF4209 domain-containing protein n=1 Tax=Flavobacterium chilense TaxID=946677 RepID=A0A1M7IQX5_9FLAO|nr:DUF4209 domain-containing protein [Flavobacterium chilense]SHM43212.1 protein of unknown function [Flavobacterium chilense]
MSEIINKHFLEEYDLGTIRTKSNFLLHSGSLEEMDRQIISYIDVIGGLSILDSDSNTNSITEYRPGRQILNVIASWGNDIVNPYIRGFLFDILQCNKINKFANAKSAIEAYLKICEVRENLSEKRDYYIRLINILKGLGKGNRTLIPIYFEVIKHDILKAEILKECYSIIELVKEMTALNLEPIQYEPFILKIENNIGTFLEKSEFKHYRECHQVLAILKKENLIFHRTEIARGYIMEADDFDLLENASQHMIAELYKKGLRIFKLLNIKNKETKLLANKLLEIQKKAAAQLIGMVISQPASIDAETIELPGFDNIYQAVYWLIGLDLPSRSESIEEFEKSKNKFMHLQFLSADMTNSQGNTIGISEDSEKLLYRDASMRREIICKMILKPFYNKFCDNFAISETEVYELVSGSIFISTEQLPLYVHGLYNGFCGNFAIAVHLLIPQIEAGLRFILKNNGVVTTKYLDEVQTENGLTSSLNNLKGILHEDLLFDLEGLLNEPFGDNLRNDLSHGLVDISKLYSAPGFYTWWLALKLSLEIEKYIVISQNTNV